MTLDNAGGGFAISKIELTVRGEVEGMDEAAFRKAASRCCCYGSKCANSGRSNAGLKQR